MHTKHTTCVISTPTLCEHTFYSTTQCYRLVDCYMQGLTDDDICVLSVKDIKSQQPSFSSKQVFLCTPAIATGLNGLDFVNHVIFYSVPYSQMMQIIGRFDRPSR